MQVSHDGVVDVLEPALVKAHVMRGPQGAELLAVHGEFSYQVGQGTVVRVPAGLGAQVGDEVAGGTVPVQEEVTGPRVEEHETGNVHGPHRIGIELGVQRIAEPVGAEDVPAPVAHIGRRIVHGVENPLDGRPDLLLHGTAGPWGRAGGPGEVDQMLAFRFVQLERTGDGV